MPSLTGSAVGADGAKLIAAFLDDGPAVHKILYVRQREKERKREKEGRENEGEGGTQGLKGEVSREGKTGRIPRSNRA